LWRIRSAAQKQQVSVSELVRTAVARYLGDSGEQFSSQHSPEPEPRKRSSFGVPLLDIPLVNLTPEEEAAHRAMQLFRNYDEITRCKHRSRKPRGLVNLARPEESAR
jgi:hypothetical protein